MINEEQALAARRLQILQVVRNFLDEALRSRVSTSPYFLVKTDVPIIAGYSIYRDAEFLRSSIDSICMYVNAVLLLDGRFLDFIELEPDSSYEIIADVSSRFDPRWFIGQAMNPKIVYFNTESAYGPMLEIEKRDLFFQTVRPNGFLFTINGDEVCVGDVKAGLDFVRTNPETKIFWVHTYREEKQSWEPRIIKVEAGHHYGNAPSIVLDKKNELVTDSVYGNLDTDKRIDAFSIFDFGAWRSGERAQAKVEFQKLKEVISAK